MGIFRTIYNWLAQRNIGNALGMRWNPSTDEGYQRQMKIQLDNLGAVEALQITLPNAYKALSGKNYENAHWLAKKVLVELSTSRSPLAQDAVKKAQQILKATSPFVRQSNPNKSSSDYFNEANTLFSVFASGAYSVKQHSVKQHRHKLSQIIHLCQLAIEKDGRNGDAHVMLAVAYFMLALNGGQDSEICNYCESKAGAVIHRWRNSNMYTKNQGVGQKTYTDIARYYARKYPKLPPRILATQHDHQYFYAIDPKGAPQLEEILARSD